MLPDHASCMCRRYRRPAEGLPTGPCVQKCCGVRAGRLHTRESRCAAGHGASVRVLLGAWVTATRMKMKMRPMRLSGHGAVHGRVCTRLANIGGCVSTQRVCQLVRVWALRDAHDRWTWARSRPRSTTHRALPRGAAQERECSGAEQLASVRESRQAPPGSLGEMQ